MKKFNILCSIDGWLTTKNVDKVQTIAVPNIVLEHSSNYEELPDQLDIFCVSVEAADIVAAERRVQDKLSSLDTELRKQFGEFDIYSFSSYCAESKESAIDIQYLSLSTIINNSKLLQLIEETYNKDILQRGG